MRNKRRGLHGVVGGAGAVAILAGVFGVMPFNTALFVAIAIWILGSVTVNLFTDPPG